MRVFMFPGQGSQRVGMGSDLFGHFPAYVAKTDEIVGYSIEDLCLRDEQRQLSHTGFTQVALYVVGVLSYLRRIEQTGEYPDWVLGHSLGEYCALFAAAAFDFETGLRLVKRRGELMAAASEGAMAAVIGLTDAEVEQLLADAALTDIDLANSNGGKQVVVAGPRGAVVSARPAFEQRGARYVVLDVGGAFHSRLMADAGREFASFLDDMELCDPRYPVLSNVEGRPYGSGQLRRRLAEQIVSRVRWADCVRYLLRLGATEFEELGVGNVLTGLVARIKAES